MANGTATNAGSGDPIMGSGSGGCGTKPGYGRFPAATWVMQDGCAGAGKPGQMSVSAWARLPRLVPGARTSIGLGLPNTSPRTPSSSRSISSEMVVFIQWRTGCRVRVAVGPGDAGSVMVAVSAVGVCHSRTGRAGDVSVAPLALRSATAPPRPGKAPEGVGPYVRVLEGVAFKRSSPTNWSVAESPVPGTLIGGSPISGAVKSPMAEITLKLFSSSWKVSMAAASARVAQARTSPNPQRTPRPTRHGVSMSVLKLTSADALRLASCVGSLVGV